MGLNKTGSVLLIIFISLFLVSCSPFRRRASGPVAPTPTPIATNPTPIPSYTFRQPPAITDRWLRYVDSRRTFEIDYPASASVQPIKDGVKFNQLGPSQSLGTNFQDGLKVTVQYANLPKNVEFRDFVQERITVLNQDPSVNSISTPANITIDGKNGIRFSLYGENQATHYYIDRGKGRYLHIINESLDPNNQGYGGIVDRMIGSMTIKPG